MSRTNNWRWMLADELILGSPVFGMEDGKKFVEPLDLFTRKKIRDAPRFDVTDVISKLDSVSLEGLCLRPPFPQFWIEATHPNICEVNPKAKIGMLVHAHRTVLRYGLWFYLPGPALVNTPRIKLYPLYADMSLNDAGMEKKTIALLSDDDVRRAEIDAFNSWSRMLLFGIGLMNCPEIIKIRIDRPKEAMVQRAHNTEFNFAPCSYHILDISDKARVRYIYDRASNSAKKMPLHVVRAHEANYEEGRGLFGEKNCTVHRQTHVRGDWRYGVKIKDYNISKND